MRRFTEAEKQTIWDMREAGVPVKRIARHLGRQNASLRKFIADAGGHRPRDRSRSELHLSLAEREEMLREAVADLPNVRIVSVSTLVVNVARDVGASAIVKGLRAVTDFENELQMAQMNRQLSGIETLFIPTSSTSSFIASRLLREVAKYGGDVSAFVPKVIAARLAEKFGS